MFNIFSNFFSKFISISKELDNYQTLNKIKITAISVTGSLIIIFTTLAAFFIPLPTLSKVVILVSALCIPLIILLWIQSHVPSFIKKAEKDLLMKRLSRKKIDYLEGIIQNSNDIIFTVDSELLILKFNKGAQFHLGYTQEEVLGKPLSMLFTNEKEIHRAIKTVTNSRNIINTELSMQTKAGDIRQINLSISKMNYETININGFVITAKDITETKKLEEELRKTNKQLSLLAITDSLTELYNVRYFYDQIKRELKRHSRNPQRKLSLILIDIDRFKELNDMEGHQMGDHVLASLAQVIQVCIRQDVDSAYRYGGDEFVIILPDTDHVQADVVARRIQKQFGAFKFGMTSLSIGITEAHINDNEETIVKRADDAMYSAKRSGKGYVSIA